MSTLENIFNGIQKVAEESAFEDIEKIIQYCELDVSKADIRKTKSGYFLISNARRPDSDGAISVFTSDLKGPTIIVKVSGGEPLLFNEKDMVPFIAWTKFPAKQGSGFLAQRRIGDVTLFAVVDSISGETSCVYCTRN